MVVFWEEPKLTFVFDQLLDAVGDGQVAGLVHEADVARAEPAVLQTLGGGGGVVVVAAKDVGPLDVQLAGLASGQLARAVALLAGARDGAEFRLDVGNQPARGADGGHPVLPALDEDGGRGLAQAVPLLAAHALSLEQVLDQVARQGCRAAVGHAQRRQVVLLDHRRLAQQQHDRRHDVREGDALLLHGAAPLLQVEARHDQRARAREDRRQHQTVQPVDVEERQTRQDPVALALGRVRDAGHAARPVPRHPRFGGVHLLQVGRHVVVRQPHALGPPRRAGRVHEEREVGLWRDLGRAVPRRALQVAHQRPVLELARRVPLASEDHDVRLWDSGLATRLARRLQHAHVRHHHLRPGVLQLVHQLRHRVPRVCRADDSARPQRPQHHWRHVDVVRHEQTQHIALFEPVVHDQALSEVDTALLNAGIRMLKLEVVGGLEDD